MTSFTSAARQVARQTGLAVREARVVGSQHGYQHLMLTLAGGRRAFAKVAAVATVAEATGDAADEMAAAFAAEASSLRWLAEADAVPVPEVLAVTEAALVISMIPPGHATPSAAFRFGTELARLHAAGSEDFGAPWRGFIASLPLDNTPAPGRGRGRAGWAPAAPEARAVRMAAVVREPQAAALPAPGGGLRRAAARRRAAGGGGDGPDRRAGGPGRAAEPHSR